MGLFDRKAKAAPIPELPPTLSDADLVTASQLLNRWLAAAGNSDAMWACIDSFAQIGSYRGFQAAVMEGGPDGRSAEDVINRPWRWWAEAARFATAQGEHVLCARIFLFCSYFVNFVLPNMSAAEQIQTGLGGPTQGTYESIAASAAVSLDQLPPELTILDIAGNLNVAIVLNRAKSVA